MRLLNESTQISNSRHIKHITYDIIPEVGDPEWHSPNPENSQRSVRINDCQIISSYSHVVLRSSNPMKLEQLLYDYFGKIDNIKKMMIAKPETHLKYPLRH